MTSIVIIGAGGHARVVADIIRLSGKFGIHGFIDSADADRHRQPFEGASILGGESLLPSLLEEGVAHAIVAIGDNQARLRIGRELLLQGFELPVLVHPAAVIAAGVTIGPGSVVMAGAVINPGAVIGPHVIVNTAATIDHDCVIGEAAHVAVGAHLAGNVIVEAAALLGVGAVVRPGIRIGANAIVGVGAAVVRDVASDTTVVGVPARVQA